MFVKRYAAVFSALNLVAGFAYAQSIFDKAPKGTDKPEITKPAAAAALATLTGAAPAAAPAATPSVPAPVQPRPLTIKELADKQAAALAADANKPIVTVTSAPASAAAPVQGQVVGELLPASPIPVTMANPPKPLKPIPAKKEPPPKPPRPYLAALGGFKGKEVAEVHIGSQIVAMKVGDSIAEWKVRSILDGRLFLTGTSTKKVKGKTVSITTDRVLSVGDFL